ncbi:SDR family NAD(P)-dependent oxidoreductase [Haliea sp. E1-2-M8]|uniref:SDR family NAD(P)-dependent oxidoreductase n=1 Tax=Haliea sp. E1-2-M8 TaxID=3064706 RepID=UPI002716D918|nr:SDR family NAD(P)-dependent oxidoreductase [Haliea sp. E1-2-M8]MDO8863947.1 SDR family NAD(P)-dependent oxidoreductase [Haliea sp. E1-2-M8]
MPCLACCEPTASRNLREAGSQTRKQPETLAVELEGRVETRLLQADLITEAGRALVCEAIVEQGPLEFLVNNAGFGATGIFAETDLESQQQQVDLHITATLALTHAALPAMLERKHGFIINLSSVAAFSAYLAGMVYSGTKAFLNLFSEGLQMEVADRGLKIQSLCPGFTYSEFHDRETIARAGFSRSQVPEEAWMTAAAVVESSLAALTRNKVIVVTGEHNLAVASQGVREQLKQLSE